MKKGYKGIMTEAVEAIHKADKKAPEYIKQEQFWKGVVIACNAANYLCQAYADLACTLAEQCSDAKKKTRT